MLFGLVELNLSSAVAALGGAVAAVVSPKVYTWVKGLVTKTETAASAEVTKVEGSLSSGVANTVSSAVSSAVSGIKKDL